MGEKISRYATPERAEIKISNWSVKWEWIRENFNFQFLSLCSFITHCYFTTFMEQKRTRYNLFIPIYFCRVFSLGVSSPFYLCSSRWSPYGVFERKEPVLVNLWKIMISDFSFINLVAKRGEILIGDPLQAQSPSPPPKNRFQIWFNSSRDVHDFVFQNVLTCYILYFPLLSHSKQQNWQYFI